MRKHLTRKRLIIIALILAFVSGFLYIASTQFKSPYADFTHFQSSTGLHEYLSENLVVGKTSKANLDLFLAQESIGKCTEHEGRSGRDNYDYLIICRVNAPAAVHFESGDWLRDMLNNMFISWFYDMRFYFDDDNLIEFTVQHANLAF